MVGDGEPVLEPRLRLVAEPFIPSPDKSDALRLVSGGEMDIGGVNVRWGTPWEG